MITHFLWAGLTLWSISAHAYHIPLPDPCAAIAGEKWILPREARACMSSFQLDPVIKSNVSLDFFVLRASQN